MTYSLPFQATGRPRHMAGRRIQLEKLHQATFPTDQRTYVVAIKGSGGVGKTRLLQELQLLLGHTEVGERFALETNDLWVREEQQVISCSTLFDLIETSLQTRSALRQSIGTRLNWSPPLDFSSFENTQTRLHRQQDVGASFSTALEEDKQADDAFWRDYQSNAQSRRLVLLIDTAEQFTNLGNEWLERNQLLQEEDHWQSAAHWLLSAIREGKLCNTTLLIAGREHEGETFFAQLHQAVHDAPNYSSSYVELDTDTFSYGETKEYIQNLADDWRAISQNPDDIDTADLAQGIVAELDYLLSDEGESYLQALYLYTNGQPIRLSLYLDVMVETGSLPEPLKESFEQACNRLRLKPDQGKEILAGVRTSLSEQAIAELEQVQKEIEGSFVDRLFKIESGAIGVILLNLVRSPRGLTREQLIQLNSDTFERAELDKALQAIAKFSIVKLQENGTYTLQDEVYRIFADRQQKPAIDTEREDRGKLYDRLIAFYTEERQSALESLLTLRNKQLSTIELEPLSSFLKTRLPPLTLTEREELHNATIELQNIDSAILHYRLLIEPYKHFFETYFSHIFGFSKLDMAKAGATDIFRLEVARTLSDPALMKFVQNTDIDPEPFDNHVRTLHRWFQQHDTARWILQLTMRGSPTRAIKLAEGIESAIETDEKLTADERKSWKSHRAKSERHCWKTYALALAGQYDEAIVQTEDAAKQIREMLAKPLSEDGYQNSNLEVQQYFVLAELLNTQGYSHAQRGAFRLAANAYTSAGKYLRDSGNEGLFTAELATILNNKSRALAEMGMRRSIRVCQHALQLRLQENTPLISIAYSYNTLALIYNKLYRTNDALDASGRAYAIAVEVGDSRLLSLVLKQVGTVLRRTVRESKTQRAYPVDTVLEQAANALSLAEEQQGKTSESIRAVELKIEHGSLYRDWFHLAQSAENKRRQDRFRRAEDYFMRAIDQAERLHDLHLQLDGMVNLCWLYRYAGDKEEKFFNLVKRVEQILGGKYPRCLFQKGEKPPLPPGENEDRPSFIFYLLNKFESIKAVAYFEQFQNTAKIAPQEAENYLRDAARCYAFSINYAELFAPGSFSLSLSYDNMYEHVKKLNPTEMRLYYRFDEEASDTYLLEELKPRNSGSTKSFLRDSFGDYYER